MGFNTNDIVSRNVQEQARTTLQAHKHTYTHTCMYIYVCVCVCVCVYVCMCIIKGTQYAV